MPEFSLKQPIINGKRTAVWYACWSEGRRSHRASTGETDRDRALGKLTEWAATKRAALPPELTIRAFCDAYQKDREEDPTVKYPKAIKNSLNHVRRYLGSLSADMMGNAAATTYTKQRREDGVKAATISKELRFLRQTLKYAVGQRWIDREPEFKLPGEGQPRDRYLTRTEFAALYFCASPLHLRVFLALAIDTAARGKHILSLTWDRVDFERGMIWFRPGESANKRTAPIPMTQRLRHALQKAQGPALSPYVIEWRGGRVKGVRTAYERAARLAGLEDAHRHDLRRTSASWMAQGGVPLQQIAEMLGDDIETTRKHYAKFSPDYLRGAIKALAG